MEEQQTILTGASVFWTTNPGTGNFQPFSLTVALGDYFIRRFNLYDDDDNADQMVVEELVQVTNQ